MKEVTRDDKWNEETDERLSTQIQGLEDYADRQVLAELITTPTETELVTVSLLMRIYDVQLALLAHFDQERADEVYETHEKGGHYNPPIFIPDMDAKTNE